MHRSKLLSKLSIANRLLISHGLLLALLVAVAAWCMVEFQSLARRMSYIVEVSGTKVQRAQDMLNSINDIAVRSRSVVLFSVSTLSDKSALDTEVVGINSAIARYEEAMKLYGAMGIEDEEKQLLQSIADGAKRTQSLVAKAIDQVRDGSVVDATRTLSARAAPAEQRWRTDVQALIGFKTKQNGATVAEAKQAKQLAVVVTWTVVAAALLIGTLLAWRIARGVRQSITQAVSSAERIASGDLATKIEYQSSDEIGRLMQAIAQMQQQLNALVSKIYECADSIRAASTEMAAGHMDLSSRTERAASSLQSTSGALGDLTGEISESAHSAREATRITALAADSADRSGKLVSSVIGSMQGIQSSSRKIAEITSVINGIAIQTKLLAMNAAVEAARAGEHGRSFTVVAQEVTDLSQRSAKAAAEISALIAANGELVEDGCQRAKDAGEAMNDVVARAHEVATTLRQIQAATDSQSKGLGGVAKAIEELDQMTQQNAALSEQSAAGAASLSSQAEALTELVSAFKIVRHA